MPLSGTFDVLDFSAILDVLAERAMSGRLHVRSRSFAANLFLADGLIVGADQSEHQAAALAGDVGQRVQEICFELLGADRGSFEFHPGRTAGPAGGVSITVADALAQARQRLAEWQELQVLIPSLDVQPRLVTELDPGQVTLDREQWRVLTAVDGRRNLRSIGRALNLSDFEVCRAMRELLNAKVIEMDLRPVGMAGMTEIEAPLATEQVTINGKRATRLRSERARGTPGSAATDEGGAAQTILISPNKPRPAEARPAEPRLAEPPLAEPRPPGPRPLEPRALELRVPEPRADQPGPPPSGPLVPQDEPGPAEGDIDVRQDR